MRAYEIPILGSVRRALWFSLGKQPELIIVLVVRAWSFLPLVSMGDDFGGYPRFLCPF